MDSTQRPGSTAGADLIEASTRSLILERLERIEMEEGVHILYACESGSRAWGFPSDDSDYDVRFIYRRERDWYLSIDLEHRRDVIERPIADSLDIGGWDIRKALQLLAKSNPPLLEWLISPIVYLDRVDTGSRLREVADQVYRPDACIHHYLHMARGNVREYLKGEQVWIKKYFYVLRPLLAIRWIEARPERVPMNFAELMQGANLSPPLTARIDDLLVRKRAGAELDRGPKIPEISGFIDEEMLRHELYRSERAASPDIQETLNALFRQMVGEQAS